MNFLLLLDVFVFILCLAAHLHNFLLVVCLFVYLFGFLCRLNNASLCYLDFSNEMALLVIVSSSSFVSSLNKRFFF